MSDEERLRITIEDIDDLEKPAQPETPPGVRARTEELGRQLGSSVRTTAHKTGERVAGKAAEVTSRSAEAVRDKVGETIETQARATAEAVETRLREVDWKTEAQKSATGGLKWLSARLSQLAERVTPDRMPDAPQDKPEK